MSLTWTLEHHGWARCVVTDAHAEATAIASYVTGGPEYLLTAVARLVLGADKTNAELEAYRWVFQRAGDEADIILSHIAGRAVPDDSGTIIWRSRQPVDTLARIVVRAFDTVLTTHGETGYEVTWGRPFPRTELNALRNAWHPPTETQ